MKNITFFAITMFLFLGCCSSMGIIKQIKEAYVEELNISYKSRSLKLANLFFKNHFEHSEKGNYVFIQKMDVIEVSGSSSCLIAIEKPNNTFDYYSYNKELGAFEDVNFPKHSFNKIQFDLIVQKMKNKKYEELIDLHKSENRELNHPNDFYVFGFSIGKERLSKIGKLVYFQEFAVSWKDSKDEEIRSLKN